MLETVSKQYSEEVIYLRIKATLVAVFILIMQSMILTVVPQAFASDTTAPQPPTGISAVSSANSITIKWDANSEGDIDGYYVYGKAKGTYGFLKLAGAINRETSYVDVAVAKGFTYVYYVTAVDDDGNESRESDEVEASLNATSSFGDISVDAWYLQYVNKLVASNTVTGYADGTFKPGRSVTRAEFAKMLVAAMKYDVVNQIGVVYGDVSGTHWAYQYITIASSKGLLKGYTDGTFKPEQNISREEMAKALAVAGNLPAGTTTFSDTSGSWAKSYIGSCVTTGIISGYPDKTFRPKNAVTRAETTAMLARFLDR